MRGNIKLRSRTAGVVFYHLTALLLAAFAAIRGFKLGLARQTPSIIGMAFGIICARILAPGLFSVVYGALPSVHGQVEQQFVCDTLSTGIVFISIYLVFTTVTGFLGKVMRKEGRTILDNIGGALYSIFKYMLFLSIIYNSLVALNFGSELKKTAASDDGNTAEEVMLLSPTILGGQDIEELIHLIQLEEAKKIS